MNKEETRDRYVKKEKVGHFSLDPEPLGRWQGQESLSGPSTSNPLPPASTLEAPGHETSNHGNAREPEEGSGKAEPAQENGVSSPENESEPRVHVAELSDEGQGLNPWKGSGSTISQGRDGETRKGVEVVEIGEDVGLKHGGPLGCANPLDHESDDPDSASSGADSGGSESMWKSHVGGWLQEKVPVPKPVSDALEDMLADIDAGEYEDVLRRVIAHVYYCQTRMPDRFGDGVPIGYALLKKACSEDGNTTVPSKTQEVWEPAEPAVLNVSEYIYREEGTGRSREFLLRERVLSRLDEALTDSYQHKTRYNLVDGKRLYSGFQTEFTYDGEHSWEERSTFIYRLLKRLRGQRDLVNKSEVEDHLDALEADVETAKARHKQTEENLAELKNEIQEEGKTLSDDEKAQLNEAREAAYEAGRDLERVRSRFRQDARIWSDVVAQGLEQAEDQPEGVFEYETAYEVQVASGRLTQTCGLQNASEDMKAAASTGIENYNNLDIKSSQTEALIQEMKMAVRMGAELDVSILIDYVDEDGKDGLAEQFGIDRENWKRPEHSVKFGAGFKNDTFEATYGAAKGKVLARINDEDDEPDFSRLHQFEYESGKSAWRRAVYNELPTMAQTARDWADDEDIEYDDPEKVYSMLKDAYEEMAEEIDAWRDWLVDEHWMKAGRHGSGFGYYVSNPCSLPFSIHDPRLAESGDEPDRYNQKTGYATSRLQGLEAAYIHALALIQDDFDYELLRNEHDGAVVIGTVTKKARRVACRISGFHRAELESKPFESSDSSTYESKASTSTADANTGSLNTRMESRSGARTDRMPSGSAWMRPMSLRSDTGSTSLVESSCSKSNPMEKPTGSSGSSGTTTGTTSPERSRGIKKQLEKRCRRGEVPAR